MRVIALLRFLFVTDNIASRFLRYISLSSSSLAIFIDVRRAYLYLSFHCHLSWSFTHYFHCAAMAFDTPRRLSLSSRFLRHTDTPYFHLRRHCHIFTADCAYRFFLSRLLNIIVSLSRIFIVSIPSSSADIACMSAMSEGGHITEGICQVRQRL